jgi:3-oxocholest-4-en-26-oate---CoA ligase
MGERGRDIASTWDGFADTRADQVAIASDGDHLTWRQFAERASRLSWHLESEMGIDHGDRVAIALPNTAAFLETFYAALKLGCVPVNAAVRQPTEALHAIIDHSDAKVVVHAPQHTKAIKAATKRIPRPWRPALLAVGDTFEQALASAPSSREWRPRGGAPDDLVVLYTDGAATPPTALMWRSEDLADAVKVSTIHGLEGGPTTLLPVAPLTHTLGLFSACGTLMSGGTVALAEVDPFDPPSIWDTAQRERAAVLVVPSEGTAARLVAALSETPGRWDLSRMRRVVTPSRLHESTLSILARHLPNVDVRTHPPAAVRTASDTLRVVDERTGRDVDPGSGTFGVLAVGGAIPLGYYKDREKTSTHFRIIEGSRYWISGEHATIDATGEIRSAVSDSLVIVVDGSRVSAPAVEAVLRKHPSIDECVVVGIPDAPGRERLVALLHVVEGHYLDEPEMTAWCRARLAAPETPSRFLFVDARADRTAARANRVAASLLAIELLHRG